MERLKLLFRKPYIFLWILIILIIAGFFAIPFRANRYSARLVSETGQLLAEGQRVYYCDIDEDGQSEEFIYYHFSDNRQPIINQYSSDGELASIWYLEGEVIDYFDFIAGDYNHDGQKEIYCFSKKSGMLYLYGLIAGSNNTFCINKLPVCSIKDESFIKPIVIHPGGTADLNNDGDDELIFSVSSRFAPTPRRVFAYDITHQNLITSNELGLQLVGMPIINDINLDGYPEILMATLNSASQNWAPSGENVKYSQSVVLNSKLDYLFQPNLYKSRMSVTATFPVKNDSNYNIASVSWSIGQDADAQIKLLDLQGNLLKQKNLGARSFVFDAHSDNNNLVYLISRKGYCTSIDADLKTHDSTFISGPVNQVAIINLNNDNNDEIIVFKDNLLEIYSLNFRLLTAVAIPGLGAQKIYFSINKRLGHPNLLSIQSDNYQYLVEFQRSQKHWINYAIYLIVVMVLYLLIYVGYNLHQHRLKLIKKRERELYQLQFDLMKSSLDPHFLFNALNSISFSINKDDRKTAYSNLGIFSKFMRESLSSAGSFDHDFNSEINYIRYYLILEKFRFKEQFNYNIMISPQVSTTINVPRLSLFCFVENALKKGVLSKQGGGFIEITADISTDKKNLVVTISDNGVFRDLNNKSNFTQNLQVVFRLFDYLNQHNPMPIRVEANSHDTNDGPQGCCIHVFIPVEFDYTIVRASN